jgi:hypothetical protein
MELLPILFVVGLITYLNRKPPASKPATEEKALAEALQKYLEKGVKVRS